MRHEFDVPCPLIPEETCPLDCPNHDKSKGVVEALAGKSKRSNLGKLT